MCNQTKRAKLESFGFSIRKYQPGDQTSSIRMAVELAAALQESDDVWLLINNSGEIIAADIEEQDLLDRLI